MVPFNAIQKCHSTMPFKTPMSFSSFPTLAMPFKTPMSFSSFPTLEELDKAMDVFVLCVKLAL
jgi:hypothetical protein